MKKIKKFLNKLSVTERDSADLLIDRLLSRNWEELNIKKLKGSDNLFRLRQGRLRIIFQSDGGEPVIVYVGFRSDTTYNF